MALDDANAEGIRLAGRKVTFVLLSEDDTVAAAAEMLGSAG